jgi:uncharacterized protein involved in exopolysaccharide biosynthesis
MTTDSNIPAAPFDQFEEEPSIDWIGLLSTLWSSRKLIALFTGGATMVAVIVSLLLPNYYKSTAVLLPETDKSKLGALAGLSGLASLAGVNVGEMPLELLYPTIITSEAVLKEVIYHKYQTKEFEKPVNLIEYWEIEEETALRDYEVALKRMRGELDVSLERKTNVLEVSLLMKEPQLAADVLNKLVSELDRFIRTKRTTNASEQRKWIEARLVEVKQDLEKAENKLKEFREKNRQITSSPQLMLEQERLAREVEINSTLYVELKKQYELAKIEEIKNVPIINVLDEARPAAKKDKPRRAVMVLVTFFLSALGSVAYVFTMNHYGEQVGRVFSVFSGRSAKE